MGDLKKLVCKIADIKDIPGSTGQIVSVEFNLGTRKWFKAFRLAYDRPISMEEFKRELLSVGVWPDDFLAYVKAERDKTFELKAELPDYLTAKVEPKAHT